MDRVLHIAQDTGRWVFDLPDPPPLGALLRGRTPQEVAETLPRLFNLCGAAQGIAARLSMGLPLAPDADALLSRDVLRDQLLALFITLPRAAGLLPVALPDGWRTAHDISGALWGGERPQMLAEWLVSGHGLGPLLARVQALFGPEQGRVPALPFVDAGNVDGTAVLENSPAARHAQDPLMQQAEALAGRGPLWRAVGRILDAGAASRATLPAPELRDDGMALVPAARGVYALRLTVVAGRVATIRRITPTDHMLCADGGLRLALGNLRQPALAPLLVALHDPCLPVQFAEVAHA